MSARSTRMARRPLSREEQDLWTHVTRDVKKLKRAAKKPAAIASPAAIAPKPPTKPAKKAANAGSSATKPQKPPQTPKVPHKPLAVLEPKTRRRLGRGQIEISARIDLHGMRQNEAHDALLAFLATARESGHRIVLVITGKGGAKGGDREAGVLRRLAPHWLAEPSLRNIVLGYEAAAVRHGGDGALYVRLRKGA